MVWYLEHDGPTPEPHIPLEMKFEFVRGTMIGWKELFTQAIEKAADIHPDQVVSFSHSDSNNDGVAVVWYWSAAEEPAPPPAADAEDA